MSPTAMLDLAQALSVSTHIRGVSVQRFKCRANVSYTFLPACLVT